jgi:hypothetical protein
MEATYLMWIDIGRDLQLISAGAGAMPMAAPAG